MTGPPEFIVFVLPWLLFMALGFTMIRLVYQAWQEQALLEFLRDELRREHSMIEQKQNFLRLSSHYLRTPLALINNGLELILSIGPKTPNVEELQAIGKQLGNGVNQLLDRASISTQVSVATADPEDQKRLNPALYLASSLAGAFVIMAGAVYLLAHFDIYNLRRNTVIGEASLLLLVAVLLYGARRSRVTRRLLRQHLNRLLAEQKQLDQERNSLIKGSLDSLRGPLKELQAKLNALEDQKLTKPVKQGVASFDLILHKFTILSSLESGTLKTYKEPIKMSALSHEVLQRYEGLIRDKNLEIKSQYQAEEFSQDPLLIRFVLDTLINNAVQYSPSGGQISLLNRRQGGRVEILIKDQGVGIGESKLRLLFQPFSHAEDVSADFEHRGVGLSLYLDRLIMRYLSGDITVSSPGGQGTAVKLGFSG
jgi:signal transduction histidine kinase